ncbi:hypothetical protein V8C35DRAFT_254880 [Trichoderma chlorosporum]
MRQRRPPLYEDFEVAIICTEASQFNAITSSFDEFFSPDGDEHGEPAPEEGVNISTGRIGMHNVVLALLTRIGKTGAASEAKIWSRYTALKLAILAGTCGGVPFIHKGQDEVLLGDVIINDRAVHYRFAEMGGLFRNTQRRTSSAQLIENFRKFFESFHTNSSRHNIQERTAYYLSKLQDGESGFSTYYKYPRAAKDKLFKWGYRHKHHGPATCVCNSCHGRNDPVCEEALACSCHDLGCDEKYLVMRKRRQVDADKEQQPSLHIGKIASIDTAMESGEDRDRFAEAEGVIAFEMGGIWWWKDLPCLMVRGVCDYADGHGKGYEGHLWQYYATATAAAAIKALLERYPHADTDRDRRARESSKRYFLVPFERNPNFIGAKTTIRRLLDRIPPTANGGGCQRTAITGPKSAGKTQIALEAAYLVHEKLPGCSIFWVSAIDAITFENAYYDIGKQMKIEGIDKDDADVKQLVKTALSEDNGGSWLLVVDDADALDALGLSAYLPSGRNGSILFIIRKPQATASLHIPEANICPVRLWNHDDIMNLTRQITKVLRESQKNHTEVDMSLIHFMTNTMLNYEEWRRGEHSERWGRLGDWTRSEKLQVQVTQIYRNCFGDKHLGTLASMHKLATIYAQQARWSEAEKLYISIIETRKEMFAADDPDTLVVMRELARIYSDLGRKREAKVLEDQMMEGNRQVHSTEAEQALVDTHERASSPDSSDYSFPDHEPWVTPWTDLSLQNDQPNSRMNEGTDDDRKAVAEETEWLMVGLQDTLREFQRSSFKGGRKDVEGDSGYGSASQRATTTVPLTFDIDAIESREKVKVEAENLVQSDDDIRSVVSEDDDIRSQTSDATTNEGMTGKALIRAFLAEQPHFRALCEKALDKMNRQRFIDNMSRLLKSFHMWLAEEAKSEAEKAVTGLLRSKRGRRRISEQLAAHVEMEHEEAQDFDKRELEIAPSRMQDVESWISQAMNPSASAVKESDLTVDRDQDQDQDQDSDAMDIDFEDADEPYSFPYISELKVFLFESKAFQNLQMRFALMFLSADLGYVLQSTPKENIWLSQEQDVSILNRFKTLVENTTKVRWNWWPLSPRKRMLSPGESRLFWQCTCGAKQWEEISSEQHEVVERILDWIDDSPTLASRCGVRNVQATLSSHVKGLVRYMSDGQVAQPQRVHLHSSLQSTGTSFTSRLQTPAELVPFNDQRGPTAGLQAQVAISDYANSLPKWILFGVKGGRRTLVPTQIRVVSGATDSHIFQELKRCYKAYRGRLRLWFSVWRLDYCEVVKFSRLTADRIVREHRDLPSDKDYHYDPRAGERDARNPPISPHLFQILFYACCSPCTWPFPHDCIHLLDTYNLTRIPKRTREFERDPSSPIWGFETVFAVSFSYVLAYHCLMVAGPFIFWGLWLKFYPDDLQDASVPITVVIGCLSLFWSGAGILTSRERE